MTRSRRALFLPPDIGCVVFLVVALAAVCLVLWVTA